MVLSACIFHLINWGYYLKSKRSETQSGVWERDGGRGEMKKEKDRKKERNEWEGRSEEGQCENERAMVAGGQKKRDRKTTMHRSCMQSCTVPVYLPNAAWFGEK